MLRALARMGLVYEPEFSAEMMTSLGVADQPELFQLVGFGPNPDVAVESLATYGWPVLCEALDVSAEVAEATHAMLTGEMDEG